jgi:hypothetical protein
MIWIVHEQERRSEARSKWRGLLAPGWSGQSAHRASQDQPRGSEVHLV